MSIPKEFRFSDSKTKIVMIESSTYYEAYKPVLFRLKELAGKRFPFKQVILDLVKKDTLNEKETIANKVFDLSNMSSQPIERYQKVNLRALDKWPTAEEMAFDESQYEAFKSAFRRQFVLIQGPPGTGKTYVGLKIVETLHKNRNVWNGSVNQKPIVIICYTNHALDQFLEGIKCFCPEEIVRIGSRSKSEELKQFTLNNIKLRMKNEDLFPADLLEKINNTLQQMIQIRDKISELDIEVIKTRSDFKFLENLEEILHRPVRLTNGLGFKRLENKVWYFDSDLELPLNCSQNFLEWFDSESYYIQWFSKQMDYLRRNYSSELHIAVIKWLIGCDYSSFHEEDNESESSEDFPKGVKIEEEDEAIVSREIEDRDIDTEDDNEYFKESDNKKVLNSNKADEKSLKQISKRVLKQYEKVRSHIFNQEMMYIEEAAEIDEQDLSQLDYDERKKLYKLWHQIYTDSKIARLEAFIRTYNTLSARLKELTQEETYHMIRNKQVIGMTTTGAAKYSELLKLINPKIMVVEEAAEVLECHVVTALTANTDHLILIGDHMQLRAKVNAYDLVKYKNFDVSLFERMIMNDIPYTQLKYQHRMRPEIANLIRPFIYKELSDHQSVFNYGNIRGMCNNVFFLDHNHYEDRCDERVSKSNAFEAQMIVRLAKHLLYQGHKTTQITILTFYSSQLIEIRKLLKEDTIFKMGDPKKRLIATTVDNYQGEENDIVLISFVRSNFNGDIGFLRTPNRVNVALSRAKKGLYCIGNFKCLSRASKELWRSIIGYLKFVRATGLTFQLKCETHYQKINVKNFQDFERESPCGGCNRRVRNCRMPCGHPCFLAKCHYKKAHENLDCHILTLKRLTCGHTIEGPCSSVSVTEICDHRCERLLECGHRCDLKCSEECQTQCNVMVETQIVECGHTIIIPCWQTSEHSQNQLNLRENCKQIVSTTFPDCGHTIKVECRLCVGNACTEICEKEAKCGHRCNVKCDQILLCKHQCRGSCHDCYQSRLHVECQEHCSKKLICGHLCSGNCGQNCPPCDHPCDNQCLHQTHTCSQPCIECLEPCRWKCPHKKCDKLCYEECDICNTKCRKFLECGHKCIGYCGDICPQFCLTCDRSRLDQLYGSQGKTADQLKAMIFIQLKVIRTDDKDNDCPHIAESDALTRYLQNNREVIKRCPKCPSIITGCQRFKNMIQKTFGYIVDINRMYFCLVDHNQQKQLTVHEYFVETAVESRSLDFVDNFGKLIVSLEKQTYLDSNKLNPKILSKYQINIVENQMIAIKALSTMLRQMQDNIKTIDEFDQKLLLKLKDNHIPKFKSRVEKLIQFIDEVFVNTNQQIFDIQNEIKFFNIFSKVLNFLIKNHFHDNYSQVLKVFGSLLSRSGGLAEEDVEHLQDLLPNVNDLLNDIEVHLKPNNPMHVL